jgi:hypothetical protein
MRNADYISFFETIARKHGAIAHEQPNPDDYGQPRSSFFSAGSEAEMQQALAGKANFPALMLRVPSGRLRGSDPMMLDEVTASFEIRMHIADPTDFAAINDARDKCKEYGIWIIAYFNHIMEDEGSCGPLGDFDPASVRWDFTGPINTNEYGCRFSCTVTDYLPPSYDINLLFPHS